MKKKQLLEFTGKTEKAKLSKLYFCKETRLLLTPIDSGQSLPDAIPIPLRASCAVHTTAQPALTDGTYPGTEQLVKKRQMVEEGWQLAFQN